MNIVLLSDGTGNSSAKLFRTNVWRIYEALDLRPDSDQVAFYDNGVGTASFKPLAVLGGAFGYGLKRNLLDLYTFLCRTYRHGDRIYVFGFSRGAFTIRLLIGLIDTQGIIVGEHGDELDRLARWAYRRYRAQFNDTKGLVKPLRGLRNALVRALEIRKKRYDKAQRVKSDIEFVGLWDTVEAYGLPVTELTDGWNRWIWPLALRTRTPSGKILKACHALALDDERQTFHPLLWDERGEKQNATSGHVDDERISQVWFSGMHSNVGGGYPDDGMSHEPLNWIACEAVKRGLVLRSVPFCASGDSIADWRKRATPAAPMNDSRQGIASYYRYDPRLLPRLIDDKAASVRISRPKIHESVFNRIAERGASYSPIVLPRDYAVVCANGAIQTQTEYGIEPPQQAAVRAVGQDSVWNLVWLRRIAYYATMAATVATLGMPLTSQLPDSWHEGVLVSPLPLLSSVISLAGGFLPGLASPWIAYFGKYPARLLVAGLVVGVLMGWGARLSRQIDDRMFDVWRGGSVETSLLGNLVQRLRTSRTYRKFFDVWTSFVVPHVFGILTLVALMLCGAGLLSHLLFSVKETWGSGICMSSGAPGALNSTERRTVTMPSNEICHATGILIEAGHSYMIVVQRFSEWKDKERPVASVAGFIGYEPLFLIFRPFLRHPTQRWFVPLAQVGPKGGEFYPLNQKLSPPVDRSLESETTITPRRSAELFVYVNDAVVPYPGWDVLYRNNHGDVTVTIGESRTVASQ